MRDIFKSGWTTTKIRVCDKGDKMYELEIGEHIQSAFAFIKPGDLRQGRDRVYVGDMSSIPEHIGFATENAESIIIHESTHIAIYKVTKNIPTVRSLDNIDNPMKKGGVYPISRTLQ